MYKCHAPCAWTASDACTNLCGVSSRSVRLWLACRERFRVKVCPADHACCPPHTGVLLLAAKRLRGHHSHQQVAQAEDRQAIRHTQTTWNTHSASAAADGKSSLNHRRSLLKQRGSSPSPPFE
eukprot:UN3429